MTTTGFPTDNLPSELKNGKKIKKMAQRIRNDPKLLQTITNIQKNLVKMPSNDPKQTPRQRLREKLHQYQRQRGGHRTIKGSTTTSDTKLSQIDNSEIETEIKDVTTTTIDDIKKHTKTRHQKLKQMEKKYGLISREKYTESLHLLSLTTLNTDQRNHVQNIVDLYLMQNNHVTETILESDDDSGNDDLSDLEESITGNNSSKKNSVHILSDQQNSLTSDEIVGTQ